MKSADRKFRDGRLWRDNIAPRIRRRDPLCRLCLLMGRTTPTQEIDHIHPPGADAFLQRADANLWGLCRPCHQVKTRWQQGDTSKPLQLGVSADGWPVTWELPDVPTYEPTVA